MRPLPTFSLILVIAVVLTACGGASPAASTAGESQGGAASQDSQPSQGGGGGGGANGSITYRISGDYEASGELPFLPVGLSLFDTVNSGWVAYFVADNGNASILLNLQTSVADGQIFLFSASTVQVTGTADPGSGTGCTFNVTRNDATGLAGSLDCSSAFVSDGSGAPKHATVHAEWDAHP